MNVDGKRLISKNPPHTCRIPELLKLFPDAVFNYIHRNPYEVVQSTFNFYTSFLPTTQLQEISDEELMDNILWVYKEMLLKYETDKAELASTQLLEVDYEEMRNNPEKVIKTIYQQLLHDDYSRIEATLKSKLKKAEHKLSTYDFEKKYIDKVKSHLEEVM